MWEKVGKSRNTVFLQWFGAPEGRKVGSLKRRVRSQLARWEMENCTPLWREAHFQVKMYKAHHGRSTFGSWDVEKVHAVVARSTFPSQNVQNTRGSVHFWRFRCRKSARRCGAKHISKSKWAKHYMFAPLLEVQMSKKCTPLWREAHFEVKMYKTLGVRSTFGSWDVEKVHACEAKCTKHTILGPLLEVEMSEKCTPLWREAHVEVKTYKALHVRATFGSSDVEKVHAVVARSTFRSQNVQNPRGSDHFWRFRCRFASLRVTTLHYTLQSTTLQYITLHYTPQHYNYNYTTTLHYTPLHKITLHYTTLHYTTLHYTKLHYTTLHYTPLHYTTLHSTTLHLQLHNYTPLHSTTLNYTTLRYTTLHYTPLHCNYNYTPLH